MTKNKSFKKNNNQHFKHRIFLDNYFNLDPKVNQAHHLLFKGGKLNEEFINKSNHIINESIQQELKLFNDGKINQEDQLIPSLSDYQLETKNIQLSNKLKVKANDRLTDLKSLLEEEDLNISDDLFSDSNDDDKVEKMTSNNKGLIERFISNPVGKIESIILKTRSGIIYSQLVMILLRCLVCINLLYSQSSKHILITIWEIIAESPHLWVYIVEYGSDCLGFFSRQLLKFPPFRILMDYIIKLVKYSSSDKSTQEIIDTFNQSIKSYLNYFVSKAATGYNIYRFFTAKGGPCQNLHSVLDNLGKEGILKMFGQSLSITTASASAVKDFFFLSNQPDHLVSLWKNKVHGDPNAGKIIKIISSSGSFVTSTMCSLICPQIENYGMMAKMFIGDRSLECSLCKILVELPFISSSIYSIGMDLLQGITLLKNYYGEDHKISQSSLISAICVRSLPYESTEQLTARKGERNIDQLSDAIQKGWLKQEKNGEIIPLTAVEVKNQGIPTDEQASVLRLKLLQQLEDKPLGQAVLERLKIDKSKQSAFNELINRKVDSSKLGEVGKSLDDFTSKISRKLSSPKIKKQFDKLNTLTQQVTDKIPLDKLPSNKLPTEKVKEIATNLEQKILNDSQQNQQQVNDYYRFKYYKPEEKKIFNSLRDFLTTPLKNESLVIENIKSQEFDKAIKKTQDRLIKQETLKKSPKIKMLNLETRYSKDQVINEIQLAEKYLKNINQQYKTFLGSPYILDANGNKQFINNNILKQINNVYNQSLINLPILLKKEKIDTFWKQQQDVKPQIEQKITADLLKIIEKSKFDQDQEAQKALKKYLINKYHQEKFDEIKKQEDNIEEDEDNSLGINFDNFDLDNFSLDDDFDSQELVESSPSQKKKSGGTRKKDIKVNEEKNKKQRHRIKQRYSKKKDVVNK